MKWPQRRHKRHKNKTLVNLVSLCGYFPVYVGMIPSVHHAGANVVGLIDIDDKDPAIADLSCSCRLANDFNNVIDPVLVGNDLHHRFRQKRYLIFESAINSRLAFLMAVATDVGYRQARREAFDPLNKVVKLLRTDDALYEFHAGHCATTSPAKEDEGYKDE
jgi:hypothetical protein